eukprot:GHUV01058233.1.p2 GENE.GHUV01058233.1~~GHUV01058233.1.p2  ORF type:complete len:103 (+),score=26.37 GHUV01058233.1:44-310(+)
MEGKADRDCKQTKVSSYHRLVQIDWAAEPSCCSQYPSSSGAALAVAAMVMLKLQPDGRLVEILDEQTLFCDVVSRCRQSELQHRHADT